MDQLLGTFAHGADGHGHTLSPLADPPLWFMVLLAVFLLTIMAIVAGGSIVLAASLYRNFLRPGVKKAPLNRTWTIIAFALLVSLLVLANGSPYAGWVALKSILLLLVAVTAWAIIWQRTEPNKKVPAKRGRNKQRSVSSKTRK